MRGLDPEIRREVRSHYEQFPFIEGGDPRVERWKQRLRRDVPEILPGHTVLDVGSGSGEVARAVRELGAVVVGVDTTSAATAATLRNGTSTVQGDAQEIPFRDQSFDHSIAIGVLHHTADARFAFDEMARVTRQTITVLLYRRGTPYHGVYSAWRPIRNRLPADRLSRLPIRLLKMMKPVVTFQTGVSLSTDQIRRLLADQLWTPQASFHTLQEIEGWATLAGFQVVRSHVNTFYSFVAVLKRTQVANAVDVQLERETREHYEAFPFIEGGKYRSSHWRKRLERPLLRDLQSNVSILDVGCGSGDVARSLSDAGGDVTCVDLTWWAVSRSSTAADPSSVVQASVLALPFRDGAFDHSVAIGVLHHTPSVPVGLAELGRVTQERIVVLLYGRWTPYHLIYRVAAPLRRWLPVETLDRIPRWALHAMRVVVAAQVGRFYDDAQVRRLIADQLWTPVVQFHSARQVRRWSELLNLDIIGRVRLPFHGSIFTLRRLV